MASRWRSSVALLRLHVLLRSRCGIIAVGLLHWLAVASLLWWRVPSHLCRSILLVSRVHARKV